MTDLSSKLVFQPTWQSSPLTLPGPRNVLYIPGKPNGVNSTTRITSLCSPCRDRFLPAVPKPLRNSITPWPVISGLRGEVSDMEGARLPGSAAALPAAGLPWCVQPLGYVTTVVPLATTPVRNTSCLAGSRSIAIGPFPPDTSVKLSPSSLH